MNKQVLQETFSTIQASSSLRTEVLNMTHQENTPKKPGKRILRAAFLAACLAALIAATIYAAPKLYQALTAGSFQTLTYTAQTPTDDDGNSYELQGHEIYLDVQFATNAPNAVQEFYLPQVPAEYEQYHGFLYRDNICVQYRWKAPGNYAHDIAFEQTAGGGVNPADCVDIVYTGTGISPETKELSIAGRQGYLVRQKPVANHAGCQIFYWDDGSYLFRLQIPYGYTVEEIEALVAGIEPVADIRPYLIGMTEREKDAALKSIS